MIEPTKENILYLPIKQVYFDQIIAGTKKKEYREIKTTTQKKYLQTDAAGNLISDPALINPAECSGYIDDYYGGVFPFKPREYKYLGLAVGYAKERDTAIVEVTGVSFEPKMIRANLYAFWIIVYHLGKVYSVKRKAR